MNSKPSKDDLRSQYDIHPLSDSDWEWLVVGCAEEAEQRGDEWPWIEVNFVETIGADYDTLKRRLDLCAQHRVALRIKGGSFPAFDAAVRGVNDDGTLDVERID